MHAPTLLRAILIPMLGALWLGGCQGTPKLASDAPTSQRDPRASGIVVVRSYDDEFKIDGRDVPVSVEYAWDYSRAVAIERISEVNGTLISETEQPELTLNLTDEEKAYALEIASVHPQLREQMARATHVYGGFSYREASDPACFHGSRCVHVVASIGDGHRKLVHAIVDVQSGQVVHPNYTASETTPLSESELETELTSMRKQP